MMLDIPNVIQQHSVPRNKVVSLCTDVPPPSEKISLLPIFSEGGGTTVYRLQGGVMDRTLLDEVGPTPFQ